MRTRIVDRREAPRYAIGLQVELPNAKAVTRDVSATGAFFETGDAFQPGSSVDFGLVMEHVFPEALVLLQCHGRVVRVEARNGRIGVAATIESYWVELYEEARAV